MRINRDTKVVLHPSNSVMIRNSSFQCGRIDCGFHKKTGLSNDIIEKVESRHFIWNSGA
jgi:hypothetical protein